MPSLNHLTRLFHAIATRDHSAAEQVASDIARLEEQHGHHVAAQRLRGALHPNAKKGGNGSETGTPTQSAINVLPGALTYVEASERLDDVKLRPAARSEFDGFLKEWKLRARLEESGIPHRRKLFFYGPPGCGKSLCARALGHELGLPVYVARFDAIVGAYLGQTALHLRELFRFTENTPCLLLFDEIDALGKKRGNPLDVGELDRIVVSLLQELEHAQPLGVIVATSNLPGHIDEALWRRFDLVMEFPRPRASELADFAKSFLKAHEFEAPKGFQKMVSPAKSYSEVERRLQAEIRNRIIHGV